MIELMEIVKRFQDWNKQHENDIGYSSNINSNFSAWKFNKE